MSLPVQRNVVVLIHSAYAVKLPLAGIEPPFPNRFTQSKRAQLEHVTRIILLLRSCIEKQLSTLTRLHFVFTNGIRVNCILDHERLRWRLAISNRENPGALLYKVIAQHFRGKDCMMRQLICFFSESRE